MNSKAKKNLFFISFYTFIFHFKEVRIFIQSLLLVVCCITMVGPLLKIQNKIDVLRHYITMASTFFSDYPIVHIYYVPFLYSLKALLTMFSLQ